MPVDARTLTVETARILALDLRATTVRATSSRLDVDDEIEASIDRGVERWCIVFDADARKVAVLRPRDRAVLVRRLPEDGASPYALAIVTKELFELARELPDGAVDLEVDPREEEEPSASWSLALELGAIATASGDLPALLRPQIGLSLYQPSVGEAWWLSIGARLAGLGSRSIRARTPLALRSVELERLDALLCVAMLFDLGVVVSAAVEIGLESVEVAVRDDTGGLLARDRRTFVQLGPAVGAQLALLADLSLILRGALHLTPEPSRYLFEGQVLEQGHLRWTAGALLSWSVAL